LIERLPANPDRAFFHAQCFVTVGPDGVSPGLADRPLVLAIDVGSSSVKGALHDRFGRTIRGTGVHKLEGFDSTVMAGRHLERWLLGRVRGALTPEQVERAYEHFASLAQAGDLVEEPVPPSMERMFWNSVAVISAGVGSFLAPMYLANLNALSSITDCLVITVAGAIGRRRAPALGTAVMTGGLLALVLWAAVLLWPALT